MIRNKLTLERLEIDFERFLKTFLFLTGVGMVVAAATFALTGSQEGTLYMRGDEHTVNEIKVYELNGTQSNNFQSDFVEIGDGGGSTVTWGLRAWMRDENGTETEITGGSPVATVSRSTDGAGIQSATYTPSETNVNPGDALITRVYIKVGGNSYQQRGQFITPVLNASKILNRQWDVNYYTERTSQSSGRPTTRFTRGTFYWGSPTYNSRIQGFNYSLAKLEGQQLNPQSELDTYPDNSFNHEAEATCRASNCQNVQVTPQICQGRSCSNFVNVNDSSDIQWDSNSVNVGNLNRDETINESFEATPQEEGVYRVRFNITGDNVINNQTASEVIDVDVADINLTNLEHENAVEAGTNEYETSDNISFFNTTLSAAGGTAFNVTVSPSFTDSIGDDASWGPSSTLSCGNISDGGSCERRFSGYDIPTSADSGQYNFTVDYDWENFGPETNDTYSFTVVDVRNTFSSRLTEENVLKGETSEYRFNLTNQWSESISNVNVSVQCPSELSCQDIGSSYFSSLSAGQKAETAFEVSTTGSSPGFYDINATVKYQNPNEAKEWTQVENEVFKVSESGALVTSITDYPERITRGQSANHSGKLDNTGEDAQDVYLNWTLPEGWTNSSGSLSVYQGTVTAGETLWNNITVSTDITADRGEAYVNLTSNSSAGDRGDFSFKIAEVYADTSTTLTLNASDVAIGDTVKATIDLELDTGADVEGQEIDLVDEVSGDNLGEGVTDSLGQTVIEFKVPESWSIENHTINATYSGNDTIYTNPSSTDENLDVHDLPTIGNISEEPEETGFGKNISINASVSDEDGVEQVKLKVNSPDGTNSEFSMENLSGKEFEYNFSDTWPNGVYEYTIEALDSAGYTNESSLRDFRIKANATKNVVTEFDTYGPNEDILLQRTQNVTRESTLRYETLASRLYAEKGFSDSFDTLTGTSTFHTETHDLDNVYFNMTEREGSPPDIPDEFEGVYTYSTDLETIDRIDLDSLGKVTSSSWDVQFRNYATSSWDTAFTISETTDTWDNQTFCSGSACSDYVDNGELEIRVFTQSARGTPGTYSVDYQALRIEGSSNIYSKEQNLSEPFRVGKDLYENKRLYRKFNLTQLPYYQSAEINSAELFFNVSGGFGTGEVYHTKNFTSTDTAQTVYDDGAPTESTVSNPLGTFSSTQGLKSVDVTGAVSDTFEADKRYVGFQFREQGEDVSYQMGSETYLVLNYTADSELFNTGDNDFNGYLVMRVQRRQDGSWQNVGFPVADRSNGEYSVSSGSALDLASVWGGNGGFNTGLYDTGTYRVLSRLVDPDDNILETDTGETIRDTYKFRIAGAELNLTDIEHENQYDYMINEYGTRDNLGFVNITVNNSQQQAVNASIDLNIIDDREQRVGWGPDSLKICGDIAAGGSCEKSYTNSSAGYGIPETASSGSFTFRWNTTLDADNAEQVNNYSIDFVIHDVPENFSSVVQDPDNKIIRNESTLYNFTVQNPWSGPLEALNVSVNCDETELQCNVLGGASQTQEVGTLSSGGSTEVPFNISTDENTALDNFDVNATVEYVNPGDENKTWKQRENKILQVRIPGSLLNITQAPQKVIRGNGGYEFKSYNNNTFDNPLTNSTTTWEIPERWVNTTGSLTAEKETQQPQELLYNNFTAKIQQDSSVGEVRINISATNDQGRVDDEFVRVDVFAGTVLNLSINETDPAADEQVRLTGVLKYRNGTPISGRELSFRDETTATDIGSGFTNSTGGYSLEYVPGQPLGDHIINASYSGSNEDYLTSSTKDKTLTVRDRPNVTDLSADPENLGFGFNTTINATVTDVEGVSSVSLDVTYPNGTVKSYPMQNIAGDTYAYNFSETWQFGDYNYDVVATDSFGKTSSNSSFFTSFVAQKSSIQTKKFDYFPAQYVNLTDKDKAWWNRDYSYRRKLQINETSGNDLVKYPSKVVLENLDSAKVQSSCEDLRVVENFTVNDLYIESCNPDGTTEIYVSSNLSASTTQEDTYLYYGNSEVTALNSETFAYRINDSGVYDPGKSAVDNIQSYNGENATFRQIDITVFGDSLDARVDAYNLNTNTWETLFQGNPGNGENILNNFYLQNPRYSRINVELTDTSNNPSDVSYEYNYTTPKYTDATDLQEESKLPSVIQNVGETDFRGLVDLKVLSNTTGNWEVVETVYKGSTPTTVSSGDLVNFADLWNSNPFYTGSLEEGFYAAKFFLRSDDDEVLSDGEKITRNYTFRLNPPRTEVGIQNIEVYNVTGATNPKQNISDLEDSGLNSTLQIKGGESYRFDIVVNNSETAGVDWEIENSSIIRHLNLNSSWTIDTANDIFYTNGSTTYTGGDFNGNVSWNTSGGTVAPGGNATFSYIVDVPNDNDFRNIEFRVNDTAFIERDYSELDVVELETVPPSYLQFGLNDTEVERGDTFKGFAEWDENIDSASAEYNSTTAVLNNFTVTPDGVWTNTTVQTDSDWKIGNHTFRFYAADANGNQNSTFQKIFSVFGIASVTGSGTNQSTVQPGEEVLFTCQVEADNGTSISGYDVSFYNETSLVAQNQTNSTGGASISYSSTQIGFQDLTCGIGDDKQDFYTAGVSNATETVRIAEEDAPDYFEYGANKTRVFKSTKNTTIGFYSNWTDNKELDYATITEPGASYSDNLPNSSFELRELSGTTDWANWTIDIPLDSPYGDRNWSIYANDTSSNINSTLPIQGDIWAWSFITDSSSGPDKSIVGQGQDVTFFCKYEEGNGTGVKGYNVSFWDNNTGDGSYQKLGVNQTQSGGLTGFAQFTTSYSDTGSYELKCNATESYEENLKPFEGFKNFSATIEVTTGDTLPPYLENGNYGLNTTSVFKGVSAIKSFAQWNETIDTGWVEYNTTNSSFVEKTALEPYTANWTNVTLKPEENWSVGEHQIKTYANDSNGNVNNTLDYLNFDVWGYSNVTWVSPTGTVVQGENELTCRVRDNQTGSGISDYEVSFYDDNNTLIGTNTTGSQGYATYDYNTSDEGTGERTWGCGINDETSLYYNTSANDLDTETASLVSEANGKLNGTLEDPVDGSTLAKDKFFDANATVQCREETCGDVTATLRYNQSGNEAGTAVSETSDTPFYVQGSNQKSCGNLDAGQTCNVSWDVNASGAEGSVHSLDAQLNGTTAETNDTEDNQVEIDVVLILDVNYSKIDFPQGNPGEVVSGPKNTGNGYFAELTENSNDADGGAWIKLENLTRTEGPETDNRIIEPENTTWSFQSTCSYSGSEKLSSDFTQVLSNLNAGENFTQCFWQEIPYSHYFGLYNGTLTIKVNATN